MKSTKRTGLKALYEQDPKALEYYTSFRLEDGRTLEEKIPVLIASASMLNAVHKLVNDRTALRKALGGTTKKMWDSISDTVNAMKKEYGHNLPENPRRLKAKMDEYIQGGYGVLINGRYGNQNSRKVSLKIEKLILSLYCLPDKPYATNVMSKYLQFLGGAIDVADISTGEIYDRREFFDEDGQPIILTDTTIWRYINDPKNRILVDKRRMTAKDFNDTHRPYHHRHAPVYSFSKISLDDRDLPRKMHDGNRVKAYYAYDVTSGAVIGRAYSRLKTTDLLIDCVRNMFRGIMQNGWKMPAEAEVEHHLVNNFKDDLFKSGTVFPFVRWCIPGNSQEKRAEHFNRAKKYGVEKTMQPGIGRWYAKLEANRPKIDKVFDEFNNTYKEKTYSYEQLVADDMAAIEAYNNELHPKQNLYPGMTRWQVLCEMQNPNLANVDRVVLTRYLGEKAKTSIKRSKYVTVQYAKYELPSPVILNKLDPNNLDVEAYYLPNEDGIIESIFLYQNDSFICECLKTTQYNESKAEWGVGDEEAYQMQKKYVTEFTEMCKEGKFDKVEVISKEVKRAIEEADPKAIDITVPEDNDEPDYEEEDFSIEAMRNQALNRL